MEFYIQPSLVNFQSVIKLRLSDFELSKSPSEPSFTLLNSVSMVLDHSQTLSAEVDIDLRNLRCLSILLDECSGVLQVVYSYYIEIL